MDDPFDSIEQEQEGVLANNYLRSFEKRYFADVAPVSAVEFVNDPTFASRYHVSTKSIQINAGVARFPRLVQFLILHELIHHKLFMQNAGYAAKPYGTPFQEEVKKMLERGAYDGLL
jgi:hypothetical protein